ncbi:MAG: hemin receptor [Chloroflexi bacterium]|jgi:hemoglobin-like flavoprotein|uniref:Hemin receptor n=1 Tax=Candidatus Thermofonsia Clade 3 bacterium TaxID=2364212 RepID=A0A2M8QAJ5_9CHLR|nr:globin family protein [Candidatus Roseilinea sp. NK_OTU-006]PJF46836.1 MAG: hemin receptor [Candidatus Thermofonsia Clade 3 bacterium]RMG65668.1 MAG: hemin receptor [Chloroflexota bacterium]
MEAQHIALVQQTFAKVEPIAQEVGDLFYNRLFEMDPSVRPLFKGDMKKQALMLMTVIGLAVRGLDRPEAIAPSIRALGERHSRYGVKGSDYHTFGAALIWALEQVLGDAFTPEVKAAWIEAYDVLAGAMKKATLPVEAAT